MNRNTLTAILATITVATVIAITAVALANGGDDSEAEHTDLVGHWYVIDAYGDIDWFLTDDGAYLQSSGMDVFDIPDGIGLYGKYMGHPMAGQITAQGRLEASISIDDMTTYINGGLSERGIIHIVGNYVIADPNGDVHDVGTYVVQMSKIWSDTPEKEEIIDIKGNWKIAQAFYPSGDEAHTGYSVNLIQERNRCAITLRDGLKPVAELYLTTYIAGDFLSGVGIATSGNVWILIYDGDTISLDLNLCSYVEKVPDVCQLTLSRDGRGGTSEPFDLDILGTSWRSVRSTTYWPDGNVTVNESSTYMTFEEQNGNMYSLDWIRVNSRDVTINVSDHGITTLHVWCVDKPGLVAFHGTFDKEARTFDFIMINWQNGMLCLSEVIFEESRVVEDSGITGHWYMVKSIGYDSRGELSTLTPGNGDIQYDLDIYGVSEGLLYGRFGGSLVTGSYLDGILTIYGSTDFGLCAIEGRIIDENTMIFTETYFNNIVKGTTSIDSWMTILSRDMGGGAPEQVTSDILGKWILSYGKHYDGTSVELKDCILNITAFHENVLFGTIKDATLNSVVKGSILPYGDGSSAAGVLMLEDGNLWSIVIRDGRIIIKAAVSDDSAARGAWAAQGVFTRSGEPVTDDIVYPDMTGTWISDSVTTMDIRGTVEHGDFPYEFRITGQDGFGFVGFSSQPGIEGVISASLTMSPNGLFTLHVASDFSINDDIDLGYGWLDDEGGLYIVETYVNAAGMQTNQLTHMVRTSG